MGGFETLKRTRIKNIGCKKIRSGLEKVGLCEMLRYSFCYLKVRRENCNFDMVPDPQNLVSATVYFLKIYQVVLIIRYQEAN